MRSALCLEYQARSRGESTGKKGFVTGGPNGTIAVWIQKYLPCKTCKVGKQVKAGKIKDDDVDKLIEKRNGDTAKPERTCEACGFTGPDDRFHKAGNTGIINKCLSCVSKSRSNNKRQREETAIAVAKKTVTINLANYPEIQDSLFESAKANFRTIENEVLFRLVNYGR